MRVFLEKLRILILYPRYSIKNIIIRFKNKLRIKYFLYENDTKITGYQLINPRINQNYIYRQFKLFRFFTYETHNHYIKHKYVHFTKKRIKYFIENFKEEHQYNKLNSIQPTKQKFNHKLLSKKFNYSNKNNIIKQVFSFLYSPIIKIFSKILHHNFNYKSILYKIQPSMGTIVPEESVYIKKYSIISLLAYTKRILKEPFELSKNTLINNIFYSIQQLKKSILLPIINKNKIKNNSNTYDNILYPIATDYLDEMFNDFLEDILHTDIGVQYEIHEMYLIYFNEYIYFKHLSKQYKKYLNYFFGNNLEGKKLLKKFIQKINYITYNYSLNTNTNHLFTIRIIGFLSKYYLICFKQIDSTQINKRILNININNKFKYYLNKKHMDKLSIFNKYFLNMPLNNNMISIYENNFYYPIKLKFKNNQSSFNGKIKNKINLYNNTSKRKQTIDTLLYKENIVSDEYDLRYNKLMEINNLKNTNLLSKIIYKDIFSFNIKNVSKKRNSFLNVFRLKTKFIDELYKNRQNYINTYIKNKGNIMKFNKQIVFYNENKEQSNLNNVFDVNFKLILIHLLSLLPINILILIKKNIKQQQIKQTMIWIYIYIIKSYMYNLDKISQSNLSNKYIQLLINIIKNIHITLYNIYILNTCSTNESQIENYMYTLYKNNNQLNNMYNIKIKKYNDYIRSYSKLNTKLFNKITKLKLKKIIYTYQHVNYTKYLIYKNSINTISIYYKEPNTYLNNFSKHLFYMKSIDVNNNYNLYSKSKILHFRKSILLLTSKYEFNRWNSYFNILLDLISNYKTIHKDSTLFDINQLKYSKYSKKEFSEYLLGSVHPYPNNIFRTSHNDNILSELINYFISPITWAESERNLLESDRMQSGEYFISSQLYNYIQGNDTELPFDVLSDLQMKLFPNQMVQSTMDITTFDNNLWNIPLNQLNLNIDNKYTYKPSYFKNEVYYLDYMDFILYKYYLLDNLVNMLTKKLNLSKWFSGNKFFLKNRKELTSPRTAFMLKKASILRDRGIDTVLSKERIQLLERKIKKIKKEEKVQRKKNFLLLKKKKNEFVNKVKLKAKIWYAVYIRRTLENIRNRKFFSILTGRKIDIEEIRRAGIKKKKEKKKSTHTDDFIQKFNWDINAYDLNRRLFIKNQNFENVKRGKDNVLGIYGISVQAYMLTNLLKLDIDFTPFQISAIRMIEQQLLNKNNKSKLKNIDHKLKLLFDIKMDKDRKNTFNSTKLLKYSELLNTLKSNKSFFRKKDNFSNPFFYAQSKIKTFNRPGLNDLSIFPYYFNNDLKKEIYLYRKIIGLIYRENNHLIQNVEHNRRTKSIIKINDILRTIDIINCNNIQDILCKIDIYKKNIIYYIQIIMPYHHHYKSITADFLFNAFDYDYEWMVRNFNFVTRNKYLENKLPHLKSAMDKFLNTKNKNYFYSDDGYKQELFYDIMDANTNIAGFENEGEYIIQLIDKSNRDLIDNLYVHTGSKEDNFKQMSSGTIINLFKTMHKFNIEFHAFMASSYNKAVNINTKIIRSTRSNKEYEKYRYNIIEDINNIIRKNISLKIPISIMLLFMARYPIKKKFYKYIDKNIIYEIYKNIWLNKSIMADSYLYLSDLDYNVVIKQLNMVHTKKSKILNDQLQDLNNNSFKYLTKSSNTNKYDKLYNLYIERRFLWHLSKSIAVPHLKQQIPHNMYNNIYSALNMRSKYTNNKLQLFNIEQILEEQIDMYDYLHNIVEIPHLYYANYLNKQIIYLQLEAVMGLIRDENPEQGLKILYYKSIPFQLCKSNNTHQLLIYYSAGQIKHWNATRQYLTYPIFSNKSTNNIHSFIRYRINNADMKILGELGLLEQFETTKLFSNLLYNKNIKKLGEIIKPKIYKEFFDYFTNPNYSQHTAKILYYYMYNNIEMGVLNYMTDVTKDKNKCSSMIELLEITNNTANYLKYSYENIINELTAFYYSEEKSGKGEIGIDLGNGGSDVGTDFVHIPYSIELENILLFKFLHNLKLKKLIFSKNEYKFALNSNKIPLLLYSIIQEPMAILIVGMAIELIDSESLNILKYNIKKIPKLEAFDIYSLISFPLGISNSEDTEDESEEDELFTMLYMRNDQFVQNRSVSWPEYINDEYEIENFPIVMETEPLRLIGMEITISPLFRMFTFSGWKIWKEMINSLLIFQNKSLWNINYSIDTVIFDNLFLNSTFITKPIHNIDDLKKTLKSYNLHENILPSYLNKYHYVNNNFEIREWYKYYAYGLLEYQRTIPDSYEKIFMQPAIRSYLHYFFINNKEYDLISKKSLSNLVGSVYSMQLNPVDNEEFFVYPNRRTYAYRTYTPSVIKKVSWLENYSRPVSNYSMPRTGNEAYIYSYAANIWYSHYNLITSNSFWHAVYNAFDYITLDDPGDFGSVIRSSWNQIKKLFSDHDKIRYYPYNRKVKARNKRSEHEIAPSNVISKYQVQRLKEAREFAIYDLLKDFFVPNTIKFTDLNLLYKPYVYKQPIENNIQIRLHPSIQEKYTLKSNHTFNAYSSNLNIIYPKQKINKMLFLNIVYPNNIFPDKLNFLKNINPIYSYINIQPNLKDVVKSHRWYSKSIINSNAYFHENAYGPLWSIYQKNIVPSHKALESFSLGTIKETLNSGLLGMKRDLLLDYVDETTYELSKFETYMTKMPTSLPVKVGTYPEVNFYSTTDIEDVIATYDYDNTSLDSNYYKRISLLIDHDGSFGIRSYNNMLMKVLHSMYFPTNTIGAKNYTAYVPVGYSLSTRDLLNNNYSRLNHWYNPVYHRLHKGRFYEPQIKVGAIPRLLLNPEYIIELTNLADDNNRHIDIRDNKSKYYRLGRDSSFYDTILKKKSSYNTDIKSIDPNTEIKTRDYLRLRNNFIYKNYRYLKKEAIADFNKFIKKPVLELKAWPDYKSDSLDKKLSNFADKVLDDAYKGLYLKEDYTTYHLLKGVYNITGFIRTCRQDMHYINSCIYTGIYNGVSTGKYIMKYILKRGILKPIGSLGSSTNKYLISPIEQGMYSSAHFITNNISRQLTNINKVMHKQLELEKINNTFKKQISNNSIIKVKNIQNFENILQKNIEDLEIEARNYGLSEADEESVGSAIERVKGHKIYGYEKYPDLYFSMFQTYSPSKQPHELNKKLNDALIYKNRYRFIDIYESFRLKPFYYMHKNKKSGNNNVINYYIGQITNYIVNMIYPLENQISNDRSTKKLYRLELDSVESIYMKKGANFYKHRGNFMYSQWPQKYLRFYTGIQLMHETKYSEYKSMGIKGEKLLLFKLANLFKFNWLNKIIQSRYQKPTKNFFPTKLMSDLASHMNLSKHNNNIIINSNTNIIYDKNLFSFKYRNKYVLENLLKTPPKKDMNKEYRLKFEKNLAKFFKGVTRIKKRIHREARARNTLESNFDLPDYLKKGRFSKMPNYAIKASNIRKLAKKKKFDLTYQIGMKRRFRNVYKEHFINRFSKPKNIRVIPEYNIPVKVIQTSYGMHKEFNTSRTFMEILSRYNFKEPMSEDLFEYKVNLNKLNKDWTISRKRLTHYINDNIAHTDRKYLKQKKLTELLNKMGPTIKPTKKILYTTKYDWNVNTIHNSTGRIFDYDEKKGYSYKIYDYISSKSYSFYKNWIHYIKWFPERVVLDPIGVKVNTRIKPFKYSGKKYNFRDHFFELLNNKSILPVHKNQIMEPLSTAYQKRIVYLVHMGHFFSTNRFFVRDASTTHEDEEYNGHKMIINPDTYTTEEFIFRTSYWRYMAPKNLKNSKKYNTTEFITFKSNPNKTIDQTNNEILNSTIVRGSFLDKEIAYNYKINYKKYSLPLVEYYYYTQFGIDTTNLLQINKLHILYKYAPTIFNQHYYNMHPYILQPTDKITTKDTLNRMYHQIVIQTQKDNNNKKIFTFTENLENNNILELINSIDHVIVNSQTLDSIYLYNNTLIRPLTHWFVQTYYNNIHYFDAFYSWCSDLLSNIIII